MNKLWPNLEKDETCFVDDVGQFVLYVVGAGVEQDQVWYQLVQLTLFSTHALDLLSW